MNANLQQLHAMGQSVLVDNITRKMLGDDTLDGYIDDLSVTGLTSNPTIFEQAIGAGDLYDEQIAELSRSGRSGEDLFFALAIRDLTRAASACEAGREGEARGIVASTKRAHGYRA